MLDPVHFLARPQEYSDERSSMKMKCSKITPKQHELTFAFTSPDQGGSK